MVASFAAILVSGCSLDSGGLGDLFENADGGGTGTDATFTQTADGSVGGGDDNGDDATVPQGDDSSNGSDGAQDTNPPVDTGSDTCASNVEICNNGIDDNCNGKIDCADPECGSSQWTCTSQQVPQGWTVVTYATGPTAATCGTGYSGATNVYEGPFTAATCSCSCNVATHGSCESGDFTYFYDVTNNCLGGGTALTAGNGACEAIPGPGFTPGAGGKEKITPANYAGGTCSTTFVPTVPPLSENGHVCSETSASGGGCSNNGACVPAPAGGTALCIQHGGAMACPSGFNNVHNVGSGVTDTRGCTACTCTGPTAQCENGLATQFTDPNCGDGGTATVKADGQCDVILGGAGTGGSSPTFHAYEYSASIANEACGGSGTSAPNGSVTLTGQNTICCQ